MWEDNLLGGNGDPVTRVVNTGPFRSGQWSVINSGGNPAGPLRRAFGRESWALTLPTQQEIDQVMAITPYDSSPWNINSSEGIRIQLEGFRGPNLHNRGHGWVGGSMLPMTSPNDPVFFIHHCMVDKIWYEWQLRFPNQGYLPMSGGPFGQNLTDPMDSTPAAPIRPRPIDVLDSAALGIQYDQLMPGTPDPDVGETSVLLSVNGNPAGATIGTQGEMDVFRFDVNSFAAFTIETTGPSDTFMTLFGPNDATNQVALDDDGGESLNARLTRTLSAGTYHVMIRLFNPNLTGSYSIQVSTETNATIPELVVDGPAINAAISVQQESDLYRFQITRQGTYTIETTGITDTFLNLFGPNSQLLEVGGDDDSGANLNARVQMQLVPGEYFARVRHFSQFGLGDYSISVKS
jgi:tyrosinase